VEFVSDRDSRISFPSTSEVTRKVFEACLAEGLIVYPCAGVVDGKYTDQIMLAPPFIITGDEIDELAVGLDRAIGLVTGSLHAR
jgi:adenosylmethionine-8-amino-7-oxononanoate aminotransferase